MSFADRRDLLKSDATLVADWSLDDRIGLGPDAESDPDEWGDWADERIGLGPVVPDVPEGPVKPNRRNFLGGMIGLAAGGLMPPGSSARTMASPAPTPLLDAYRRLARAEAAFIEVFDLPTPDPDDYAACCEFEDWRDGFTDAKIRAEREFVRMTAAAAGYDLRDVPRSGDDRCEFEQDPLAVHREGNNLFLLILDNDRYSITSDESQMGIRPVVVFLCGGQP